MRLHEIQPIVTAPHRRLGRGHGSGRGKTAGRGTKGQKARGHMPLGFEGGQSPLLRRLPYLRGKGRNHSQRPVSRVLPVGVLSVLADDTRVTLSVLRANHLIERLVERVKIVNGGQLTKKLTVELPVTKSVRAVIEKAGGTVTP